MKPKDYCQCDFPIIRNGEYCGDCGLDIESKEEYHKKKLLSELVKAKSLTEHLSQEERNECFFREGQILIACEESQTITIALRNAGFEAYSCDTQECSGGHPEWHIQGDAIKEAYSGKYIAMIGHPPCTFMSKAGARWMYPTAGNIDNERLEKALDAKEFFMKLINAPIDFIAIENPVPLKVVGLPKHTQAIQPYEYGDPFSKKTLLWLKGFEKLVPTDILKDYATYLPSNTGGKKRGQSFRFVNINKQKSSKTFEGIANAIVTQWFGCHSQTPLNK